MKLSSTVRWLDASGKVIACTEKIKVLNENLEELRQTAQDAFDDGVLMGCSERQMLAAFVDIVRHLESRYVGVGEIPSV